MQKLKLSLIIIFTFLIDQNSRYILVNKILALNKRNKL